MLSEEEFFPTKGKQGKGFWKLLNKCFVDYVYKIYFNVSYLIRNAFRRRILPMKEKEGKGFKNLPNKCFIDYIYKIYFNVSYLLCLLDVNLIF